MANYLSLKKQRAYVTKVVIKGVVIGGIVGMLIGLFHRTGILIIPWISNVFSAIQLNEIIGGTLLGVFVGGLIMCVSAFYVTKDINVEQVLKTSIPKQDVHDYSKNVTLQIKQEQLNIAKKWIQTGEAKVYREIFTEEKSFIVPVKREELVIEKKSLISANLKHIDVPPEVIRISLNEEQVEFTKHKVNLEDISIYKQQVEDIKHIEETLKHEEPKVKILSN